jgi:hypothetical protein
MKLSSVSDTLLGHIRGAGIKTPEKIGDCIMQHVLARTRRGAEKIGGHTYVSVGDCVIIVSYNANGLVDYISTHSTKGNKVEDVRK